MKMMYLFLCLSIITPAIAKDLSKPTAGTMEIVSGDVNSPVAATIPMEKIRLYSKGNYRGEAQAVRTLNGDIYAIVFGTELLFKSTDGGKKWTSKSLSSIIDRFHPAFTIQKDGSFIAIKVPAAALDPNLPKEMRSEYKKYVEAYRSTNEGKIWKSLSKIYAKPYDNIAEGALTLTRTYEGRLLYPVRRWSWNTKNPVPDYKADRMSAQAIADGRVEFNLFYSDDNGSTWQKTKTFDFCHEAHIIQLHSGKLLGAFRYQRNWIPQGIPGFTADTNESVAAWGGEYKLRYDLKEGPLGRCVFKNIFVGESFDNGATWVNLHPLTDKDGKPLVIYGETHGDLVQVPDGRVVLIYDHRYPDSQRQMLARVSSDEGNTWEPLLYKVTKGNGYASSVALEDGTIVTITGDNIPTVIKTDDYTTSVFRWKLLPKTNGTPAAKLRTASKNAVVGKEVLFDASESNEPENNIAKYEWDFEGNNSFDYTETPDNHADGKFDGKTTHVYNQCGNYTVRVRVTDKNGLNDTTAIYNFDISKNGERKKLF